MPAINSLALPETLEASYELPSLKENRYDQEEFKNRRRHRPLRRARSALIRTYTNATDDKLSIIEYVAAGTAFPERPGGNGKGKTMWSKVTLATDGARKTFDRVKVDVA